MFPKYSYFQSTTTIFSFHKFPHYEWLDCWLDFRNWLLFGLLNWPNSCFLTTLSDWGLALFPREAARVLASLTSRPLLTFDSELLRSATDKLSETLKKWLFPPTWVPELFEKTSTRCLEWFLSSFWMMLSCSCLWKGWFCWKCHGITSNYFS